MWILVLVLVGYVLVETNPESGVAEMVSADLLQKAMGLGVLLLLAGVVLRMFEKASTVAKKNRCSVCKTPIAHGAIYCRAHLRNILHEEDERTHMTRIRR
jgi:predicted nucleic acid-binding Zn ribbon protein